MTATGCVAMRLQRQNDTRYFTGGKDQQ